MEIQGSNGDENKVRKLYKTLLESWNNHDANAFAGLFAKDGNAIGFDGSQMNGSWQIEHEIDHIFSEHDVSDYFGIVREVRAIAPDVYLLRSVAGMIPPGRTRIKSDVNAIQTLIARRTGQEFQIVLFQNTPAAFDGRHDLSKQLTRELQGAYNEERSVLRSNE
jgi:uncharacterized protein (TIGR02246 family)